MSKLLILFGFSIISQGQTLPLTEDGGSYLLGKYLTYVYDFDHQWDIATVAAPNFQSRFQPSDQQLFDPGITSAGVWVRFELDNRSSRRNWILELKRPFFNRVIFYQPDGEGGFRVVDAGTRGRDGHGDLEHPYFAFELNSIKKQAYYLYFEHDGYFSLPLELFAPPVFYKAVSRHNKWHWMMMGLFFTMFCYNLFLLVSLRDPAYFYYSAYLVLMGLFSYMVNGFADNLPLIGVWQVQGYYFVCSWVLISVLLFADSFLDLKNLGPSMHRIMLMTAGLMLLMALANCFNNRAIDELLRNLLNVASLLVSTMVLVAGFYALYRKHPSAVIFLWSWGIFQLAVYARVLSLMGIIPRSDWSFYGFQAGGALEAILLSIVLANRINHLRTQRDQARLQELENDQRRIIAEKTSRAKSDFLATMSHEIRTPMNGVLGMTEILLGTELDEKQRHFMGVVHKSGKLLMRILNDILDISKIEAGKLTLEVIPFELDALLDDIGNLLALKAEEKGIELAFRVEKNVPDSLIGDPIRLEQVIINLVGNAIKFTESGLILVEIRVHQRTMEQVQLNFSITDTGIGMTEEQVDQLFQPFSQAEKSITRRFGGTGLGLAISRMLVEKMGGEIGVESEVHKGSKFWFNAFFQAKDEPTPLGENDLKGKRVLIVDDHETNRLIIAETLNNQGLLCLALGNGPQALATLNEDRGFDLMVLDYNLPDMNGVELLELIRERDLLQCPAIFLSSSDVGIKAETLKKLNISAQTMKPISRRGLERLIQEALLQKKKEKDPIWEMAQLPPLEILVAEDNGTNRMVVKGLLKRLGQQASFARNGREALQMMLARPYDLVLMDCEMPIMSGLEAARRYRSQETGGRTPIIALTAHALDEHRHQCIQAGMDDFLSKPINLEDLHAAIRRSLPRARDEHGS